MVQVDDILGGLATVTSIALSCAPFLEDIPAIKRDRTTGDRSANTFVAIWANACLWIDYGIASDAFYPISTTNLVGLATGSYFLWVYYKHSPAAQKSSFFRSFLPAIAFVAAVYAYTFLFPDANKSMTQLRVGLLCCTITIALYASPIGTTWRALQLRTPQMISLPFVLIGACNGVLWSGFGMLKRDSWVYVPNMIGSVLALLQIAVYFHLTTTSTITTKYGPVPTHASSLSNGGSTPLVTAA